MASRQSTMMHQERTGEGKVAVLGRAKRIQRSNMLFNAGFGDGLTELELLPGANGRSHRSRAARIFLPR
jgi:hypothetical protein